MNQSSMPVAHALKASSVGSALIRQTSKSGRIGRIHSVFHRVANVTLSDGHLLSLVDEQIGKGPLNIVVRLQSGLSLSQLGLARGQNVFMAGNRLMIENVTSIVVSGAEVYRPKHDFSDQLLPVDKIDENLSSMIHVVIKFGRMEGLGELIEFLNDSDLMTSFKPPSGLFARRALPHLHSLMKAMHLRDIEKVGEASRMLIGLGPGLTPASDDLLGGLMLSNFLFTENLTSDVGIVAKINKEIAEFSDQTTLQSREYIRQAALGNGTERIVSLIEKLLTGSPTEVESATHDVLAVGATSGTDTSLGIILGARQCLNLISRGAS